MEYTLLMRLTVPYIRQATEVFCGPACAQMMLKYFKKSVPTQDTLARIMKTDRVGENGTKHGNLANYLRSRGLIVRVSRNSRFSNIERALAAGFPSIVHYTEPSEEDDHYAMIVGLTPSHIVLNDPWNGKDFSLTRSEFMKRWKGTKGTYVRWMLLARPEGSL
jgi:ABC-type bacteriocin/lantibiotic exporter with double-glycine peptidase domain